jgi:predicted GH43/DUF377 family glycosyl hydrolase
MKTIKWQKRGVIFKTDGQFDWMHSHACTPTAYLKDEHTIRLFFAPRNKKGQSMLASLDLDADNPNIIKGMSKHPLIKLGELGTFDDGGIMPCSLTIYEGRIYLYYVGWNPSVSVPYRNAIGLLISDDNGETFQRPFPGAVIDRNRTEPFFTASPCVYREESQWHMIYATGYGFENIEGRIEPKYALAYAYSEDGINWDRNGQHILVKKFEHESTARPTIYKDGNLYRMWFCYRGTYDFRDGCDSYQIGYAESSNLKDWERMDDDAGISYSEAGWDSTMQTYPNVIRVGNKLLLFYNGNGFGKTGIGYAEYDLT